MTSHEPSDRPLRIAFLTPEFVTEPQFDGGLANYIAKMTTLLGQAGHDCEVFVLSEEPDNSDYAGCRVHRVSRRKWMFLKRVEQLLSLGLGERPRLAGRIVRGSRALAARFHQRHQEQPFDVVQASDCGATALFVSKTQHCPVITRLSYDTRLWREMGGIPGSVDRTWREKLEARSVRRSSCRYAPSTFIARHVAQRLGVATDVLHPPIWVNESAAEPHPVANNRLSDPYLLFFGRVCKLKGVDTLAKAAAPLLAEQPQLRLVMVGREDPPGIVAQLRESMGDQASQLIHHTRMPHSELFPLIRQAVAVVLPSRVENFPNSCAEAMALGQLIVATEGHGMEDMIQNGKTGLTFQRDNVEDLSRALRKAISLPPAERSTLIANAAAHVEKFSPQAQLDALLDYYRAAIAIADADAADADAEGGRRE